MNYFSTLTSKLMAAGVGLAVVLLLVVVAIAWMQQQSLTAQKSGAASEESQIAAGQGDFIEVEKAMVSAFPEVPVYPGAELKESSKRKQPIDSNRDYAAEWHTKDAVPTVADWYMAELPKVGWKIDEAPDDRAADEQVIRVSKGDLTGYVAVEYEFEEGGGIVEIVADFRKAGQ